MHIAKVLAVYRVSPLRLVVEAEATGARLIRHASRT
jgi:hypothetical protein